MVLYIKSFRENKEFGSRSDRRLTQVGTELNGFVFRMGYAASFARLLMRGSRTFCQLGGGGPSPTDTKKLLLYYNILNYLICRGGPMVYFKENYKLVCFLCEGGGSKIFRGSNS